MKRTKISNDGLFTVARKWIDEEPIREELFSVERLEQYAATLAAEHQVSGGPQRGQQLLPRFAENGRRVIDSYRTLAQAALRGQALSPAAEWLVDNFHVVEEQLRQIRQDLPPSYYYQLPKLSTGEMRGYPRIYAIALIFVAHTDSRFDGDSFRRFLRAYQQFTPLTIGELWAAPITLRLALVENLRRLATRVVAARQEREEADLLADSLLAATDEQQSAAVANLIRQLEGRKQIGRAFVVQLTQRLRDQDPDVAPLVEWLERGVQSQGQSIEQIVQLEHQRQATAQVTVGNIITSMKLLSTFDWPDFVESVSLTEPILGADPAGAYAQMDFATRDHYRHVIEHLARRTRASELAVARRVIALAEQAQARDPQDGARAHVGFYLIDEGRATLERELRYRLRPAERARRVALKYPALFYLGIITLLRLCSKITCPFSDKLISIESIMG